MSLKERISGRIEWMKTGSHKHPMDVSQAPEAHCLCCGTQYRGSFCPCCGQPAKTGKLTLMQGVKDLFSIFTNFDSGFFHTCFELIYRPGYMIDDYLRGIRREYIKPLQLMFLLGTCMLALHYALYGAGFAAEVNEEALSEETSRTAIYLAKIGQWLMENRTFIFLIVVCLLTVPNWLVFRLTERGRNMTLAEHFFAMVYVGCQTMIFDSISQAIEHFTRTNPGDSIGLGLPFFFMVLDSMQLYRTNIIKAALLCILSTVIMLVSITMICVPFTMAME